MVKLLEYQKECVAKDAEKLESFTIALLCSLLDIFESDLSTQERLDIKNFCRDWCK